MIIFFSIIILFSCYLLFVVLANKSSKPSTKIAILNEPKNIVSFLEKEISITIWNIGYAGLGKNSDFITDGGKRFFPPSRNEVNKNLIGIQKLLKNINSDIYMLQEVSEKSPLSFLIPVRTQIISLFLEFFVVYRGDIASKYLPWPLKVNHGTLTIAKAKSLLNMVVNLPFEPNLLLGMLKRNYGLLVTQFAIENSNKQWVIVNLHLSAFDKDGATRQKQFDAVFAFAKKEYQKGNYVILGGDWNMELLKSDFTHTTDKKHLFWRIEFPIERLPKGWKIGADNKTPTVRTNNKPYIKGENHTSIIDGFIVSPNVKINNVNTLDINFEHTDHQPVSGSFSTK